MPKQMDGVAFGVQLANLDLPHDIEFPFVSPGAARRHGRRDQRRARSVTVVYLQKARNNSTHGRRRMRVFLDNGNWDRR